MDKRYQVFVSSTYADLRDERRRVIQTLMEMDCIPAGMELFPAVDEEQWEFIKRVIDDCDYYVLIMGGRYGSRTSEGISYTQKEYDYAIHKGLKIVALLHENPDQLPVERSDIDPEVRGLLATFRDKVTKGRVVRFWSSADELPSLVALSLNKTIKTYPAVGWVRADLVATTDVLAELNDLRKRNQELELNSRPPARTLADREEMYGVFLGLINAARSTVCDTTWGADASAPTQAASDVREQYLSARAAAVERNVTYREVFSRTKGKAERIAQSMDLMQQTNYRYSARVLQVGYEHVPIIDFAVVDRRHVILSDVRCERYYGDRFVYVDSPDLGRFFQDWFEDVWASLEKEDPQAT